MSRSLFYCSSLPPSTQVALRRAGYETLDEISGLSAETLSKGEYIPWRNGLMDSTFRVWAHKELGIAIPDSQALISASQAPRGLPLSQSVASLSRANFVECSYLAVNKILGCGLPRGHVLEISGPPGSFKESLALDFVRKFVEFDEDVIFVGDEFLILPLPGAKSSHARHARHDESQGHFRCARK